MAVEEGARGQVHRVHPGILPNDTVARTDIGIGACSGVWLGLSACARAHAALNTASHVVSAASNDVTCAAPSTTAGAAAATVTRVNDLVWVSGWHSPVHSVPALSADALVLQEPAGAQTGERVHRVHEHVAQE